MSPTDIAKREKKLRGFTLIELIIVMAIIAILAAMLPMMVEGYRRNALVETANNKAHMAYTGFQNVLINCEINQNVDIFDIRKIKNSASTDKATYCVVAFQISNGAIVNNQYTLTTMYGTSAGGSDSNQVVGSGGSNDAKKAYKKFETFVKSNLSQDFTGAMAFYIDLEDYLVDSAVYCETISGLQTSISTTSSSDSTQNMIALVYESGDAAKGKSFATFNDFTAQKNMNKRNGIICGAYPLGNEIAGT